MSNPPITSPAAVRRPGPSRLYGPCAAGTGPCGATPSRPYACGPRCAQHQPEPQGAERSGTVRNETGPAPYRILVTGSREGVPSAAVWDYLDEAISQARQAGHTTITVVHGDADGADTHAAEYCEDQAGWYDNTGIALHVEPHRPNWATCSTPKCTPAHRRTRNNGTTFCPAAALHRDAHMVALGAHHCLAFIAPCVKPACRRPQPHGSHGASYTADLAEKAGIPVRRWPE
ncbi:SLOG family protein [Streptosporangium sp. NPDC002721]|uniref:SLOG family protein n=1 Tax=Streptosporangium sp. NPDC002721 TaxID=3366188 RepID=UPI00369FCB3B